MIRTILTFLLAISALSAQAAFDVASVRATQGGRGEGNWKDDIQASPGSLIMRGISLKGALRWAYHVMDYQVTGPAWIGSDRYDIAAKAGAPVDEDQLRVMLQALLKERFQIELHKETKELKVYSLTVGKNGVKFHESKIEGEPVINPDKARMTVEVKGMPASQIVDVLSRVLQAPVMNNTGYTGRYDAAVNIARYMPDGSTPFDPVSTILLAVQEELGLKLEMKKMALDLVIVDRAEKIPVEN